MAKKRPSVLTSHESHSSINLSKTVLIPWDDETRNLEEVLRALIQDKQLSQLQIAKHLELNPKASSHVARWLNEERRGQIPLSALDRIAEFVGWSVVIALVKKKPRRAGGSRTVASSLREFYVSMAYLNPTEGPQAVSDLIAKCLQANSWSLYREDARLNILEWFGGSDSLQHRELMRGLSWSSELPTRVVTALEKHRTQEGAQLDDPAELPTFDWKQQPSAFAQREGIEFCIALPIHEEATRTTVLFLSFSSKPDPPPETQVKTAAKNALTGSALNAWRTSKTKRRIQPELKGSGPRDESRILHVVRKLIAEALRTETPDAIGEPIKEGLLEVAAALWPDHDQSSKVHRLVESSRCSLQKQLELVPFRPGDDPDEMARRASVYGETFYVEDLGLHGVRARFDRKNRISPRSVQRLAVPIHCEEVFDHSLEPVRATWRTEAKDQVVLQCQADLRKLIRCWGAITVDSEERIFSPAKLLELNVAAHLLACALYLKKCVEDAGAHAKPFFAALVQCASEIFESPFDVCASISPLDKLCKTLIEQDLFAPAERCAIYPYDRAFGQFQKGGNYISEGWIRTLKSKGLGILVEGNGVKYLDPRKGGNSERLLGVVDEYHVIPNAQDHPRVSPSTKIIGTQSLIGCSCRVGCSFRSEAALWLGFRKKEIEPDYLEKQENRMFHRLRAAAHVAGMFCVAIRWWG